MMATAALAAAGFLMGDLFINAEDVLKKDSRIVSYQLLVDTVRKNIYAGSNCTAIFGATSPLRTGNQRTLIRNALGVITSGPIDVLNLTDALDVETGVPPYNRGIEVLGLPLKIDDTVTVLEKGWRAKTGTSIKSMRLVVEKVLEVPPPYAGNRTVRYPASGGGSVSLRAVEAKFVIEPDHKGINVWAPENQKYWIKVYAYIDAANQIHSCYDPSSEAVFCTETMKGVYINDPALPADKRCRPDVGCFTYKSGVIPASEPCPDSDYVSTTIALGFKTCTWCPAERYPFPTGIAEILSPGIQEDYLDLDEFDDIDCSAPNPWAVPGLTPVDAYREYLHLYDLFNPTPGNPDPLEGLSPAQRAELQGCIDNPPACQDLPETCAHECGGSACTCPTGFPDDSQAYVPPLEPGETPLPGQPTYGPPTPCYNECTGTAIYDDPTPYDCSNECGGAVDPSCTGTL
jgi:hypothetical protein